MSILKIKRGLKWAKEQLNFTVQKKAMVLYIYIKHSREDMYFHVNQPLPKGEAS